MKTVRLLGLVVATQTAVDVRVNHAAACR